MEFKNYQTLKDLGTLISELIDGKIQFTKKIFDQETGLEKDPLIESFSLDYLTSKKTILQNNIIELQNEIDRIELEITNLDSIIAEFS